MKTIHKNFFERPHKQVQIDELEKNVWSISAEGICLSTVFGSEIDALNKAKFYQTDRRDLVQIMTDSLEAK